MICLLQIRPLASAVFKQKDDKHFKNSVTFCKVSGRLRAAVKPSQDVSMITVKLVVLQQFQTSLQRLVLHTTTSRLLTRWHSLNRSHSHHPVIHRARWKTNALNGNSPSLRLCLVPFLLPEEWEEPTGRSFHSAPAVVILEETGWEDDSRVGGRGSCVLVDGMRESEREKKGRWRETPV